MPLYEYQCKACGHIFDQFSSMNDRNIPTENPCSECGLVQVSQKIGPTPLADPVRLGRIQAPEGFKDVLRNVKDKFYGSQINVN